MSAEVAPRSMTAICRRVPWPPTRGRRRRRLVGKGARRPDADAHPVEREYDRPRRGLPPVPRAQPGREGAAGQAGVSRRGVTVERHAEMCRRTGVSVAASGRACSAILQLFPSFPSSRKARRSTCRTGPVPIDSRKVSWICAGPPRRSLTPGAAPPRCTSPVPPEQRRGDSCCCSDANDQGWFSRLSFAKITTVSDVPMMKPDGLRSVVEVATREKAHAYRDERWLRSCQMSGHTVVANTKEVEHAKGRSHSAG
jgi:hypothetical protein